MNIEELKATDVWELYEKGRNFMSMMGIFSDTDKNYRMYGGNQWEGAKIEGIEQAQYNFIETIVNYKVSAINQNLYAINFSSENFETREFRKTAERVCKLLNKKASKVWEKDSMDNKVREISDDSAINDEGIIYVNYDKETQSPLNEVIDKNDIQFGNEQRCDIQSQPYIIISQRRPIIEVQGMAIREGITDKEKLELIIGDNDTLEQSGENAKIEKDPMCTIVTKMWKEDGIVRFSKSTRFLVIKENADSGLHLYPVAHFVWKEKKGSARGEGEVRYLIPNQLELNKTLARMLLSIKQCAYAQKVADISKIANPSALNQVGALIKTNKQVEDVSKIFTYIQPASMSTDVSKLIQDLIGITRELKNASEIATGGINPEDASGRAILAVQQASQQPLVKQHLGLKKCLEDVARIWLDMWTVYPQEGMTLEEEVTDPMTGETYTQLVEIEPTILENLKGTAKIDITPKGAFDRYARELTLENFLKAGYFNAQRIGELRNYAEALPDDATAPKQDLLDICDRVDEEQQRIAEIEAQAKVMQQRALQFISEDPEAQASQIIEAQAMADAENMQPATA